MIQLDRRFVGPHSLVGRERARCLLAESTALDGAAAAFVAAQWAHPHPTSTGHTLGSFAAGLPVTRSGILSDILSAKNLADSLDADDCATMHEWLEKLADFINALPEKE